MGPSESRLSRRDLVPLSRAWARQAEEVTTLVAAKMGKVGELADLVSSLGGKIQRQIDEIDYLRIILPRANLEQLSTSHLIEEVVLDGSWSYVVDFQPEPKKQAEAMARVQKLLDREVAPEKIPPVLTAEGLLAENPYVPTRDIGAPQFVAANPKFDGRGVTIGIIENAVDFSHEVLQHARELDGSPTPKVMGIYSSRAPGEKNNVTLKTELVEATGGSFEFEGVSYRPPQDGTFRFAWYEHNKEKWALLWHPDSGVVWFDLNSDRDFSNETPIRDFNSSHDTIDLPAQRRVPIALTLHPEEELVCIYIPSDHTTGMAGIAAGKGFLGGEANGVAPAARLALVHVGGQSRHNVIEAFALGAALREVDLLCCSLYCGSYPDDGESFASRMIDRISMTYGKLIVIAAGNFGSFGLSQCQDMSNAKDVLSVGGYSHGDTLREVYGNEITQDDWVSPFSSRGPSASGALKPDVVAPSLMVVAQREKIESFSANRNRMSPRLRQHSVPPNYQLNYGTSLAAPCAAGAAALLISAAKQNGVKHDPSRLRWALKAGARFMPEWAAHEQGAGLIQVAKAWEVLKSDAVPAPLEARGPILHGAAQDLRTPGTGSGLYEREGWRVGDRSERTVTLKRVDDSDASLSFRLSLVGNDGTFECQELLEFPSGAESAQLPITIHPVTSGPHSAILSLEDPESGLVRQHVMMTVVASEGFSKTNSFTITHKGTLEPLRSHSAFLDVPDNVAALLVTLDVKKGAVAVHATDANGECDYVYALRNSWLHPYTWLARGKGQWVRLIREPDPGVWEIKVDEDLFGARLHSEFELSVTLLGASIEPPRASKALLHNLWGPLESAYMKVEEAAISHGRAEISRYSPALVDIDLAETATALVVCAEAQAPSDAEIAILLYRQTNDVFYLWDMSKPKGNSARVRVRNPKPGLWRAAIHSLFPVDKQIAVRFTNVIANPKIFGDGAPRSVGESWSEDAVVKTASGTLASLVDREAEQKAETNSLVDFLTEDARSIDTPCEIGMAFSRDDER